MVRENLNRSVFRQHCHYRTVTAKPSVRSVHRGSGYHGKGHKHIRQRPLKKRGPDLKMPLVDQLLHRLVWLAVVERNPLGKTC